MGEHPVRLPVVPGEGQTARPVVKNAMGRRPLEG
jgi:hypothetical protein